MNFFIYSEIFSIECKKYYKVFAARVFTLSVHCKNNREIIYIKSGKRPFMHFQEIGCTCV